MPDDTVPGAGSGDTTPAARRGSVPEFEPARYLSEAYQTQIDHFRTLHKAEKARADAAEAKAADATATAAKASSEATAAADARVIKAEMRAIAAKAGIVDPDALSLADVSGVKLDKDGNVVGAEAALEAFKTAKPWAFAATGKQTGTTSGQSKAPKPGDTSPKMAKDMTADEYRAAKAGLGINSNSYSF